MGFFLPKSIAWETSFLQSMFAFSKEHCYGDAAFPKEKQYCLENKSLSYLWGGQGAGGTFPKPSYKLQFPLCPPYTCMPVSWIGSWKDGGKTPTMTVFPRLPSFCSIYHGSRNKTHSHNLTVVHLPILPGAFSGAGILLNTMRSS